MNKKGFLPLIGLTLPIVITLVLFLVFGIPFFLWALSALLPKLIGATLLILSFVVVITALKAKSLNNIVLGIFILMFVAGIVLFFFPALLGQGMNDLTIMDVVGRIP